MVRRQVGIVGQEDLLLPYLTVAKTSIMRCVLGTPRKLRQENRQSAATGRHVSSKGSLS